jgi:hypothetical protein
VETKKKYLEKKKSTELRNLTLKNGFIFQKFEKMEENYFFFYELFTFK